MRKGAVHITVERFIKNLSNVADTESLKNPYKNPIKARNLFIYLSYMVQMKPEYMFVGEAPGHLGCALTGIPFTDEYRLSALGNAGCLPLQQPGYEIITDPPTREDSARIIWRTLAEKKFYPLLWNIVPFHPHEPNSSHTNRRPTPQELLDYFRFTGDLLEVVPSIRRELVFALGRESEKMLLRGLGINAPYIRHPARGGGPKCTSAIYAIAELA